MFNRVPEQLKFISAADRRAHDDCLFFSIAAHSSNITRTPISRINECSSARDLQSHFRLLSSWSFPHLSVLLAEMPVLSPERRLFCLRCFSYVQKFFECHLSSLFPIMKIP